MTSNGDFEQEIYDLLDKNYVDGRNVFINAPDRDSHKHVVAKLPGADPALPTNFLALTELVQSKIAHGELGLDTYPNQLEVIRSSGMINAYATIGLPVMYNHWSFGKNHAVQKKLYDTGQQGLAYEIVINTNPSRSYLMQSNSKTMQMLVIAHAAFGHNHFFKNNYLFRGNTDAGEILHELQAQKDHVEQCYQSYDVQKVSDFIDSAHALQAYGVSRYKRPPQMTKEEAKELRRQMEKDRLKSFDLILHRTHPELAAKAGFDKAADPKVLENQHEENIVLYMANRAEHLEDWQRTFLCQVAAVSQYFYPQKQTQVMNEGCATYVHRKIMERMSKMGLISNAMWLEVAHSTSSVIYQRDFDQPGFSGFNPYTLGFNICRDIERICHEPTKEDREWFPKFAGNGDHMSVLRRMWSEFNNSTGILQFLSPKLMRDFRMFSVDDDSTNRYYAKVDAIHDASGYRKVREHLAAQYNLGMHEPNIEVVGVDNRHTGTLILHHTVNNGMQLHEKDMNEVMKHFGNIWQKPVRLESYEDGKCVKTYKWPSNAPDPVAKPEYAFA